MGARHHRRHDDRRVDYESYLSVAAVVAAAGVTTAGSRIVWLNWES
jgi:hypothetical protein